MDKQLIEEARKERDLFCAVINSHERSIELRTACDSLLIMYDQLLDESTPAEDWVKVQDGLPENNGWTNERVLFTNGKVVRMGCYDYEDGFWHEQGGGKYIDIASNKKSLINHGHVTHWKRISPPKK